MTVQNQIPFLPSAWTTELAGLSLGQRFTDPRTGYEYKLFQLHTACAPNDEIDDGEVLGFQDWTLNIVTNDVSLCEALDTNYLKPAGVTDLGTVDIPESSATVTKYVLLMVKGKKTIKTDGGDDITAGDTLIIDPSVDGTCDSINSTASPDQGDYGEKIGRALDDDDDTADTVLAMIDIRD